jgi:hypothetical protein
MFNYCIIIMLQFIIQLPSIFYSASKTDINHGAFHDVLRDYKHLKQENQRTYLDGIVHSHRKTKKSFFWQLEVFDVCTMGDTAHIDTIFKFLPHMCQHGCIDILHCCNDLWTISMHPRCQVCGKNLNIVSMCAVSPAVHTSNISSCQKKLFQFSCGCEQFH